MKITLLGTSGAEGWPGLFCRCAVCQVARTEGGKNRRTRSSALIDGVLKLDFPSDILQQVVQWNVDLLDMRAILFTHSHDDHLAATELQYAGPYFVPAPITQRMPLYGPVDAICKIKTAIDIDCLPFSLHVLQPHEPVNIAGYTVTPVLAQHDPKTVCFNYMITDPNGATLLYATDTGWYEEETWRILEQNRFDGVVIECGKGPEEGGYAGHLSIGQLQALRARLLASGSLTETTPVAATHFPHLGGMLHDELDAALKTHGICAAYDGMEIVIPTS
ncbi:MAG: Metal-dependent hydrolase of the beta-lactamase superfamily [Chthonomonadales bacterium]|nr:Metal-dependent hydrolase of the beta-lactamase superfamily [Chthonomonadales bacterium]